MNHIYVRFKSVPTGLAKRAYRHHLFEPSLLKLSLLLHLVFSYRKA